jgi:hypothetical protein
MDDFDKDFKRFRRRIGGWGYSNYCLINCIIGWDNISSCKSG